MRTLALAVLFLAAPALAADKPAAAPPAAAPAAGRKVEIKVTDAGFEPRQVKAKKGEALTLVFTRVTDRTCITAIDIPAEKVKAFELPLNKPVSLTITPAKAGVEAFHCTAMAMGNGQIIVE
ncbi:MAG TPA: cupredoxin domain-containing protein [Anaeromyxobacteraceae bacterium]|nr:cupredoxin domain-containing protein [Anaeromyxobacteraceae bacterium]